jgi:hypothetical protein
VLSIVMSIDLLPRVIAWYATRRRFGASLHCCQTGGFKNRKNFPKGPCPMDGSMSRAGMVAGSARQDEQRFVITPILIEFGLGQITVFLNSLPDGSILGLVATKSCLIRLTLVLV